MSRRVADYSVMVNEARRKLEEAEPTNLTVRLCTEQTFNVHLLLYSFLQVCLCEKVSRSI